MEGGFSLKRLLVPILIVVVLMLVSCSNNTEFQPDTFSQKDMAVSKSDDPDFLVHYGMKKSDVEKLLGAGKDNKNFGTSYDFGITVMYRDDNVAAIALGEESKGIYKIVRGAEIGMTKDEIKSLYSEKYAIDEAEYNLDYYYDSVSEKFLGKASITNSNVKSEEDFEKIYILSVVFDHEGFANRIMILDNRMAKYLR